MSIMTRLLRICRADAHGVMDQLEDKGLLLKQYLREMEASLVTKDRQAAGLAERLDRLNHQAARHAEEMDKLEQDLNLALARQKDDISRTLIRRRRARETALVRLQDQIQAAIGEKDRLSETLANQRLEYEMLKIKAEAYECRFQTRPSEDALRPFDGSVADPSDEEIELELLRRKEALAKGGSS